MLGRRWKSGLLVLVAMSLTSGASAQENLDSGKSAPKLFAESCATCHRSARGLSRGRFSLTLYLYLQKHYASNAASAWALTSYLEQVEAGKRGAKRVAATAAQPAPSTWAPRSSLRPPAAIPAR